MKLSNDEIEQVNASIREAEKTTSGEIFCIAARRSGAYGEVPLAYGAGAALLLPMIGASLGFPPWRLAGIETEALSREALVMAYAVSQFVIFFVVAALTALPPLRYGLAPDPLKRGRVHKRAVEQFMAKGLHLTKGRTGVLLFVSLAERHAEIIADDEVRRHLASDRWQDASDALDKAVRRRRPAEGLTEAVRFCGAALTEHFPADPSDVNELPDEVVLI